MEIKYKAKDMQSTMARLGMDSARDISKSIMHQMATEFVDLHDQPEALKAHKVIRAIVPWKSARKFFYHRLKRLLLQHSLRKQALRKIGAAMDVDYFNIVLQRRVEADGIDWEAEDEQVAALLEENSQPILDEFLQETMIEQKRKELSEFLL